MTDKMMRKSFFLPESVLRKVRKLAAGRHESMAASMRYTIEKGLDKIGIDDIIKAYKEENKMTKFRLFKLQIRIDSIAKKLMDKNAHKMDIDKHNSLIKIHENKFCKKFEIKR